MNILYYFHHTIKLFLFTLFEIIGYRLIITSCYCNTTTTRILQEAIKTIQLMEQISNILCQSSQKHRAIGRIYLHHTSIMLTDGTRHLWVFKQDRCRYFEKCHLMDKDLIIRIIIALHHVDFLLYCAAIPGGIFLVVIMICDVAKDNRKKKSENEMISKE